MNKVYSSNMLSRSALCRNVRDISVKRGKQSPKLNTTLRLSTASASTNTTTTAVKASSNYTYQQYHGRKYQSQSIVNLSAGAHKNNVQDIPALLTAVTATAAGYAVANRSTDTVLCEEEQIHDNNPEQENDSSKMTRKNNIELKEEVDETKLEFEDTDDGVIVKVATKADKEQEDPYENLPEEDEPTSCVICLINRQGPCRPFWRKFERCMKDNSSQEEDEEDDQEPAADNNKKSSSTLADKCDNYMFPWITCVQSYRNTYTLISNKFFEKELVEEIEKSIKENERVLLDNVDVSSMIRISKEWWDVQRKDQDVVDVSDEDGDNSKDAFLVEALARINLFDGDRPIEVAYVKDQDGNLLGYDQFTDFKKSIESKNDEESTSSTSIGQCNFHISPKTTKAVQIFALYKELEYHSSDVQNENDDGEITSTGNAHEEKNEKKSLQTLYVSSPVSMDDFPNPSNTEATTEDKE